MSEIGKVIIGIIGIFSLIGTATLLINTMSNAMRMSQGDPAAAKDIAEDFANEATDTLAWTTAIYVLIVFASALGLTGLAAFLRRCR